MALSKSVTDTTTANGDTTTTASIDALGQLQSETRDVRLAQRIESLGTGALCSAFLREEARVAPAIACCLHTIASLVDGLVERMSSTHHNGLCGHAACDDAGASGCGRLIYVGAGNSGRVAVMDCAELPVTFSIDPRRALSVIAGGPGAIVGAIEDAEDSEVDGETQLLALKPTSRDTVIGVSASGRTPFVLGALKAAIRAGALTAGITNCHPSAMGALEIDHLISVLVGPEFVAGSTRLKAGSAAKQILNMVSTCAMIKLGKTYKGLMLDVRVVNDKLRARGRRIIRQVCGNGPLYLLGADGISDVPRLVDIDGVDGSGALDAHIQRCGGSIKLACAVAMSGLDAVSAKSRLDIASGHFHIFLQNLSAEKPSTLGTGCHPSGRLFLAIDGGGTKCQVSIATGSGKVVARAESGACNVNSVPTEYLLDQIVTATLQAVDRIPQTNGVSKNHSTKLLSPQTQTQATQTWPLPFRFAGVWAGIAGVDHSYKPAELLSRIQELFSREAEDGVLRLTSDSKLLASCISADNSVEGCLSVIAGTGSVATAFRKTLPDREVRQVGRIGGWGHLLGDHGSAFDIGKRAIQQVLSSIGQRQGEAVNGCGSHLTQLENAFLDAMNCTEQELLPKILHAVDNDPKLRIASLAKVVTKVAFQHPNADAGALAILRSAAAGLVQHVKCLVKPSLCNPSNSILVLSGALLNLPEYRNLVLEAWEKEGLPGFHKVLVVDSASDFAAAAMAKTSLVKESQNTS